MPSSSCHFSRFLWFIVGNFNRDLIESIKESDTHYLYFSRILRRSVGFDSNYVYEMRVQQLKMKNPERYLAIMSKDVTAYDKVTQQPISISGHAIGLIIGSTFMPFDLCHWLDCIEYNMTHGGNQEYKNQVAYYLKRNMLAEKRFCFSIWHVSKDFEIVSELSKGLCRVFQLPPIDHSYIEKRLKHLIDMNIYDDPKVKVKTTVSSWKLEGKKLIISFEPLTLPGVKVVTKSNYDEWLKEKGCGITTELIHHKDSIVYIPDYNKIRRKLRRTKKNKQEGLDKLKKFRAFIRLHSLSVIQEKKSLDQIL
jgi:hypothetical protein